MGYAAWMVLSDRDIDLHVERMQRDGLHRRRGRHRAARSSTSFERDLARIERDEKVIARGEHLRGAARPSASTTCSRAVASTSRSRCTSSVLPIVERVLDRGCLVSSLSSIAIGPGESAQPLHADDQLIPLPKPHVPIICNTMWALTDFTADNGATRLVPGSHRAIARPTSARRSTTVPAEMRRGQRARLRRQHLARRRRQPDRAARRVGSP